MVAKQHWASKHTTATVYLNQVKRKAAQLEASSPTRGQHIWSTAALVNRLQVKTNAKQKPRLYNLKQASQKEAASLEYSRARKNNKSEHLAHPMGQGAHTASKKFKIA